MIFQVSSLIAFMILTLVPENDGSKNDHTTTYEQYFELGMDAYKQEKWSKCSEFLHKALNDFHFYKNAIIDCKLNCRNEKSTNLWVSKEQNFHGMLEESNCLRRCKKKKFGLRPEGPQPVDLDKKFEKRAPYNFLQFCQFREGKLKDAAGTAYTFYITNQDDERIIGNLQYYRDQEGVVESDFVDLERRPYQTAYVTGLQAYNDGDWSEATEWFEKSLDLYFVEEERCRIGCERPFTHTGYPDFISAVADHYVVVIVCQQKCLQKLSTFGMEELENFVSEHFNYLQFAYYNLEDYKKAATAIANFLLFKPNNEEMNDNKKYYIKNLGLTEDDFQPTQEVLDYVNYWKDVEKSLNFVRDEYILPNSNIEDDEDSEKSQHTDAQEHYMAKYEQLGIKLFAETDQLKGSLRFAADEFLREDQCLSLADLAKSKQPDKLGIRSVSLPEMLLLVKDDADYEMSLRLLLRAGDIIRHYTAAYFNQSELGTKEIKVLCRAGGDKWEKEIPKDCIPQEDGGCLGEAHAESEYQSVAYLSDISDGTGSFYFMDGQHKMQSSLQPRCGRLVGFATNDSYGVNFSWKKERCAVLITLTSNLDLVTPDVKAGKDLLKSLEEAMVTEAKNLNNTAILNEFYRQGVTISKTGEDLFGKERFAADGMATEAECQELIRLAKKYGKVGDGYRGNVSPHTDSEMFTGLDIKSALKKGVVRGDGYEGRQKSNPLGSKYVSPYSRYENFAGLNVTRALQLVESGQMSARSLQLLLDISEQGRLLVETYFNLSKPLYFDFTHLVCRTAVEVSDEEEEGKRELSHPVHSDNCMIQDDGTCVPDETAYIQRHYSALMYLNGDFEGGEFFFAHNNKSEQVSLKPQCGRLVGFNAGEYHGVKAVTKGQRCALAMWLTHDANYKEISRFHTQRELDKIMKNSKEMKSESDKEFESDEYTNKKDSESEQHVENNDFNEDSDEIDAEHKENNESKRTKLGDIDIKIKTKVVNGPEISKVDINSLDKDIDIENDIGGSVVTILSKLDMDRGIKETEIKIAQDSQDDSVVNDSIDDLSEDDSMEKAIDKIDDATAGSVSEEVSNAGFPSEEDKSEEDEEEEFRDEL